MRQIPLEGLSVAESIWPKVIQMHRLHDSFCFNAHPLFYASLSRRINQKTLIIGIGWNCCKGFLKRRKSNSLVVSAVEKESDFEVDPVKAREALRKLDEQLQTLAQKKVNSPKVRASDVISTRDQTREGTEYDMGISGTLITSVASGLIIFTIFYNFLFLTVIKPAIDGPEPIEATTSVNEAEKAALSEQFSSTRGTSVEP